MNIHQLFGPEELERLQFFFRKRLRSKPAFQPTATDAEQLIAQGLRAEWIGQRNDLADIVRLPGGEPLAASVKSIKAINYTTRPGRSRSRVVLAGHHGDTLLSVASSQLAFERRVQSLGNAGIALETTNLPAEELGELILEELRTIHYQSMERYGRVIDIVNFWGLATLPDGTTLSGMVLYSHPHAVESSVVWSYVEKAQRRDLIGCCPSSGDTLYRFSQEMKGSHLKRLYRLPGDLAEVLYVPVKVAYAEETRCEMQAALLDQPPIGLSRMVPISHFGHRSVKDVSNQFTMLGLQSTSS